MKNSTLTIVVVLMLVAALLVGCAPEQQAPAEEEQGQTTGEATAETTQESGVEATEAATAEAGGTIMWLSNLSSGAAYEVAMAYGTMICEELGYDFEVVYGDMFNDPAGNLNAVQNGMTNDVVAIMASQDGGAKEIMAEFPELYVVGYNTDFRSAFTEGGDNAAILSNEKFLGTIVDGYSDGVLLGKQMVQATIDAGYNKVSTIAFPYFAYPNLVAAAETFHSEIEEYNATVSEDEQIEVVGETKILEFAPLEESYFLEEGHGDLDAIVGFCAGVDFIYPTMKSAIANGSCSPDTKLITGGFNTEEAIVADIGGEGVIQYISFSPGENLAWSLIMLDNALTGNMYADYAGPEQIDSLPYVIDSKEDIDNVITKAMAGSLDIALTQLSLDDIKTVLTRTNPDATYADLKALFLSDQLSVDALKDR